MYKKERSESKIDDSETNGITTRFSSIWIFLLLCVGAFNVSVLILILRMVNNL